MSDIKGLREISNDPFGKLLTALSKKFSAFLAKDQAELVENPEDIYSDGQDVESAIKYHNFVMTKKFPILPTADQYYSATEPDHDKVTLMLGTPFPNLGYQMTDKSGFNNNATILGDPILVDGNLDLGLVDATNTTKSLAVKFNRPTSDLVNREELYVPHNQNISIDGITIGISYFIRFRVFDLAQQGGSDRRLFQKIDDGHPDTGDAISVVIVPTGRLSVTFSREFPTPTKQEKVTPVGSIAINTIYDIFITFEQATQVLKVYINGVLQTLTNGGLGYGWRSDLTDHDLNIFHDGAGTSRRVYGDFYGMTVWREKVVNQTEITNHFTNKLTLANIPFGQVAITNYSMTFGVPAAGSFSVISFSPDSFTT